VAEPFRACGEDLSVSICTVPWATAAGSEKGSCTAAVEYVTLMNSVKVALPLVVAAGPVTALAVGAYDRQQA